LSRVLKPFELTWRGVNRLRRHFYETGRLAQHVLPKPVISVGNIAAGGTGKTPAVIAIAGILQRNGLRPAILTRGYGRESTEEGFIVRGRNTACFGDEPVLIARRLPGIDVIVGADRFQAATRYLADHECDLFVLDDGFQHLALHRELDIVIDDPAASFYREGRSALESADIILTRDAHAQPGYPPRFAARLVPLRWESFSRSRPADALRGTRAVGFAGIANNERFFSLARQLGVNLLETVPFRDHHRYGAADLEMLRRRAASLHAEVLVTTEKDLVKLGDDEDILALVTEMDIAPAVEFESLLLAEVRAAHAEKGS
jgi:tetraacyldisaccharide 4'-kinase